MTTMRGHGRSLSGPLRRHLLAAAAVTASAVTSSAADESPLVPQTRLSITAAQWVEAEGAFRHWPELEGVFTIGNDGTVRLPMVGAIAAAGRTPPDVAAQIAEGFAQKVGLKTAPDVVVTVAEYPPIYLVGDVVAPGQYAFTPGLTVLKALALGSGVYRPDNIAIQDQAALVGEQEDLSARIMRAEARIARLEAEQRGADKIEFPEVLSAGQSPLARQIVAEETVLFEARANSLRRQRAALDELTQLLGVEIAGLSEKAAMLDTAITKADEELRGLREFASLPVQGLESSLSNLQAQRLDQTTAMTRARQGLASAERDGVALGEERHATVTAELQDARAELDQLRILLEVSQRKLLLTQSELGAGDIRNLRYTIVRPGNSQETISAGEATALAPGDILKVEAPGAPPLSRSAPDVAAEQTQRSTLADAD